jgi:hypothetical protein
MGAKFYPEQAALEAKRRREAGEAPLAPARPSPPAYHPDQNVRREQDAAYLSTFADGIDRNSAGGLPQGAYDEAMREESRYAAGIRRMAQAEQDYERQQEEAGAKADADWRKGGAR